MNIFCHFSQQRNGFFSFNHLCITLFSKSRDIDVKKEKRKILLVWAEQVFIQEGIRWTEISGYSLKSIQWMYYRWIFSARIQSFVKIFISLRAWKKFSMLFPQLPTYREKTNGYSEKSNHRLLFRGILRTTIRLLWTFSFAQCL